MSQPITLLRHYGGHSLAYSTQQPLCSQYVSQEGYIGYVSPDKGPFKHSHICAVLGDPICSRVFADTLLNEFISKYSRSVFVQISHYTAKCLESKGFRILPFGIEHFLCPQDFLLTWKRHSQIKRSVHYYQQSRFTLRDITDDTVSHEACYSLYQRWVNSRISSSCSQAFLTPPFSAKHDLDTRLVALYDNHHLIAFIQCDPMYNNFDVIGFYTSHLVYDPSYKTNCSFALIYFLLSIFKRDNIPLLSLGVSPFYVPSYNGLAFSQRLMLYGLSSIANMVYNIKGLHTMKSAFKGQRQLTYLAYRPSFPILDFLTIYHYCVG